LLITTRALKVMERNFKLKILQLKPEKGLVATTRFAVVVEFIKTHIQEEITIDKLTNLCYMSRPSFFRSFKREFGISPVDFIIHERIRIAKKLLKDINMSISQASYAVGINNLSYFFKLFKRLEGVTPNTFRKSLMVQ
jgi:AraC family transcriptional regulator of arabinose operon